MRIPKITIAVLVTAIICLLIGTYFVINYPRPAPITTTDIGSGLCSPSLNASPESIAASCSFSPLTTVSVGIKQKHNKYMAIWFYTVSFLLLATAYVQINKQPWRKLIIITAILCLCVSIYFWLTYALLVYKATHIVRPSTNDPATALCYNSDASPDEIQQNICSGNDPEPIDSLSAFNEISLAFVFLVVGGGLAGWTYKTRKKPLPHKK